ncbi:MAG: hypothetical protein ACI88A_000471 [Paraglaciecola sp.]|jgi:hypothetical protein
MFDLSHHASSTPSECESFVEQTQAYLDAVVVNGSDQELFIASYLTGHFALVVGQAQVDQDSAGEQMSIKYLNVLMLNSLEAAFLENELEKDEQKQVLGLWKKMTHNAV